jgi:hypothetical protein
VLVKKKVDCAVGIEDPLISSLIAQRTKNKVQGSGRRVIIGMGAYNRMPAKMRAMLDETLKDAAKKKKCSVKDLIWTIGIFGRNNMPVIRIKKRKSIEVKRCHYS